MGGNITRIPLNKTDNSTNTRPRTLPQVIDPVPPYRPVQGFTAITVLLSFALAIMVFALAINIMLTVVLSKKFKGLPYMLLKNIVVVDIATALLNSPLLLFGILLDQFGIIVQSYCNVQGFFHASLSAVFLNTVTLIVASRCLVVLKQQVYHTIFANKVVIHILLLAVWSSSSLLCVPPLNRKGWGAYKRFEATCWLAWIPDNKDYMAYNSLITILTLGPAAGACAFGMFVMYSNRKVGTMLHAQAVPAPNPPPYPGAVSTPMPDRPPQAKTRLNTDVFIIAIIQFVVYFILWLPLTVMNSVYLKDWRDIEFRVITTFLFLFMGRTIMNPIFCLVVSADIRKKFISTIFGCRCKKREEEMSELEL